MTMNDQDKNIKPKLIAKLVIDIYDNGTIDIDRIAIVTNDETGKKKKVNGLPELDFVKHLDEYIGKDYAEQYIYEKIKQLFRYKGE